MAAKKAPQTDLEDEKNEDAAVDLLFNHEGAHQTGIQGNHGRYDHRSSHCEAESPHGFPPWLWLVVRKATRVKRQSRFETRRFDRFCVFHARFDVLSRLSTQAKITGSKISNVRSRS